MKNCTAVQWLYESNPQLPEAEARTRLAKMGIDADRAMLKTCQSNRVGADA